MRASLWTILGWSLVLVLMASCRTEPPPPMTCATVAGDTSQAALRQQIGQVCAGLAILDSSARQVALLLDNTTFVALREDENRVRLQQLGVLMQRKIGLLRNVETALTASNTQLLEALFGEAARDSALRWAGQQIRPAIGRLSDVHAALDTASIGVLDALVEGLPEDSVREIGGRMRVAVARQDSLLRILKRPPIDSLSARASTERVRVLGGLMGLSITLLDSIHTALGQSNTRFFDALAAASEDTVLAALYQDIGRLTDRLAALDSSNAHFLDDLGTGGIGPLGEQASRERSREFGWQMHRQINLMGEIRTVLEASNTQFIEALSEEKAADSVRRAGYQIHEEIARLNDIHGTLEQTSSKLLKVQFNAAGGDLPVDSLRQIGNQIRGELNRQRLILDAMERHDPLLGLLSAQASSERLQETARQLRREIDLLDEAHSSLAVSNAAFRDALVGDLQQYGGKLFLAILVITLSFFVVRGLVWLLETLSERSAAQRLFFKKLIPIGRLTVWGLTIYIVLADIFKLDQRGLLAAATALGVAIGFAAQDILKNIFGGILIIFDQPFQVGDKINVGGTYGEVVSIGLRSTRIVTPDDNLVSVPNSQVVDSQVANANAGALDCQVVVDLFLPGWVDVIKAKDIAYSAAANSKYVYLEKPIVVNIKDEFKETFLTQLKVKAYVLDTRYEFAFASDVTETAKAEFLRTGLLWPIVEIHAPLEPPANGAPDTPSPLDPS